MEIKQNAYIGDIEDILEELKKPDSSQCDQKLAEVIESNSIGYYIDSLSYDIIGKIIVTLDMDSSYDRDTIMVDEYSSIHLFKCFDECIIICDDSYINETGRLDSIRTVYANSKGVDTIKSLTVLDYSYD